MKKAISRKDFLTRSALVAGGLSLAAFGSGILTSTKVKASGMATAWPWPYPSGGLDKETARIKAHDAFWSGKGCSYACFEAMIACLRETVGSPYTDLPTELMIYGHGGGVGWGATCGTINGCAAAISLVCAKADSDILINELYGWYTLTEFPSDESNTIAKNHGYTVNTYDMDLGKSVSHSPLCHASVTNWCNTNNILVSANERKERCARLCGDTAAKTVEILNAHFAGTFTPAYVPPSIIATCNACHGKGSTKYYTEAKMDCASCHGDDTFPHTNQIIEDHGQDDFKVEQNSPNPFNHTTKVEFSISKAENVTIEIYNLNGKHIKTLTNNTSYGPGTYSVEWDGKNEMGQDASSGMYFFNLKTSNGIKTLSMIKQ
ncbi:MAG TPA: T9SS type A sorting domain-containing protein [Bacteroidia bacterium]|nr:T9SS type A sorting domain-containing protein [Sphingobacteriales bacterium]HPD63888.1 T9SS type A sorting domain-containing protein [Bacteroidia bacterium]HRS57751.1 T9SS type A sorting domain-containing protein [Bacteroidia bacterium]HRU67308.1 T9SS type A sorting domain-containing protein [Bacteroidia bacterium]